MADQFDTFKKEIEEDLQRERMQKLWNEYGTYAMAAAVALVLGVAGYKYNESRTLAAAEANSAAYSAAVAAALDKSGTGNEAKLATLAASPGGYGALARLRLAAEQVEKGQKDKALASYEALARDGSVDRLLTDYAALQAALLKMDSGDWNETKNRLIELAADANPWRHHAREALGIAAFRAGNMKDAREQLQKLVADGATPRSISERVQIVLGAVAQAELATAQPAQPAPPTPPTKK